MSEVQPSTPPSITEVSKNKIRRESMESNSTEVGSSESLAQTKAKTPSSHPDIHQSQRQLTTPNTPFEVYKKPLLSPSKSYRQTGEHKQHAGQLETPRETPRRKGSTRKSLEDAIKFRGRPKQENNAGSFLFPLAASTIGGAGKIPELRLRQAPESHLELGDDLLRPQFVNRGDDRQHLRVGEPILSVKKVRNRAQKRTLSREEQLMNYTSDEESEDERPEQGLRKVSKKLEFGEIEPTPSCPSVPSTPENQLTSEKYAFHQYIEEKSGLSDDEAEELHLDKAKPLVNPFVGKFKPRSRQIPKEYSRFANEVELVNQRTGKKVVRTLNEYERSIKPKILFAQPECEDQPQTSAQTPPNHVQIHIRGISGTSDVEEDDPNEIIRHERIFNPFRGKSRTKRGRESESRDTENKFDEIEYINQTSGRRVKRKMSPEELAVKPKRLRFDDC